MPSHKAPRRTRNPQRRIGPKRAPAWVSGVLSDPAPSKITARAEWALKPETKAKVMIEVKSRFISFVFNLNIIPKSGHKINAFKLKRARRRIRILDGEVSEAGKTRLFLGRIQIIHGAAHADELGVLLQVQGNGADLHCALAQDFFDDLALAHGAVLGK